MATNYRNDFPMLTATHEGVMGNSAAGVTEEMAPRAHSGLPEDYLGGEANSIAGIVGGKHGWVPGVSYRLHEGQPLVYLDNGATTQKPLSVIKTIQEFYTKEYATIHRGVYKLSQEATLKFDQSRDVTKAFLNAGSVQEIIFTRGTTEAINLVARSLSSILNPNQKTLLVTQMDHHANYVPWQQIAKEKGLNFRVAPITQIGEIDLAHFEKLITPDVAIVAFPHISNALGTINPVSEMTKIAKKYGAYVLIDGAQAAPHIRIDVQKINCDFYCFSAHKCYGPTGVGVLYGKKEILEKMPPFLYGGDMVESVSESETTFAQLPEKFEAGTPAIAEIIGTAAALTYIQTIGLDVISKIETQLCKIATEKLTQIPGLSIIGTSPQKAAVISFTMENVHPHDIGTILDTHNICIRAGHHCAQPVMRFYEVPATARLSFSFYNTEEEIDRVIIALNEVRRYFL